MDLNDLLDQEAESRKLRVGGAVGFGIDSNPEDEANNQKLAKRYGLPPAVVGEFKGDYQRRAKIEDTRQAVQSSPTLEQWIAENPDRLKMSHDDLPNLTEIAKAVRRDELPISERPAQFIDELAGTFRRGLTSSLQAYDAEAIVESQRILETADIAESGDQEALLRSPYASMFANADPERIAQIRLQAQKRYADNLVEYVRRTGDLTAMPMQPALERFSQAEGAGPTLSAFGEAPTSITLNLISQSLGQLAPMAPFVIGGGLAGGVRGLAAGTGASSFATGYVSDLQAALIELGVDVEDPDSVKAAIESPEFQEASRKAFVKNSVIGAFDATTAGLAGVPLASGAIANILAQTGVQAAGGASGEVLGALASGDDPSFNAAFAEAIAELPGGVTDTAILAVRNEAARRASAERAERNAQFAEQLNTLSSASKVAQRDTESFERFVEQAAADGPIQDVYLDANTLMQSGLAEPLAAVSPSAAEQMDTAIASGGQIRIPIGEYTARVAPTELSGSLLDHVKFGENDFSRQEANEYMQTAAEELQAQTESLAAQQEEIDSFRAEVDTIRNDIRSEIDVAGAKFHEAARDAYASLVANWYATTAAELQIPPSELRRRFALNVRGVAEGQVFDQGESLDGVREKWSELGIDGRVSEKNGVINLSKIVAPEKGKGIGTNAMQALVDYADRTGQRIELTASEDFGGNRKQLVEFYKRFGFVENKGKNGDFETQEGMFREPATQSLEQSPLPTTIEVDGQQRPTTNSESRPIHPTENNKEGSPEFAQWAGDNAQVVDSDEINDFGFSGEGPFVLRVYHGTTHSFEEFSAGVRGNLDGQFGAVNYFTSSEHDAEVNYTAGGSDLTLRIDLRAERIADEIVNLDEDSIRELADRFGLSFDPETESFPEALPTEMAREELQGDSPQVMELFVRTEKPFVIGNSSPWIEFFDETALEEQTLQRVADDEGVDIDEVRNNPEDYEDQIDEVRWELRDGIENPLISAIETVASNYDVDPSEILSELVDDISDGEVQHSKLEQLLRQNQGIMYADDPESGALIGSQMIADVIQELGFDSIVLKDADARFSNMNMEYGTAHVHVFDANNTNIKSATNNLGTYDRNDPNIYRQGETARGAFSPDTFDITLLEGADLSTFLHELGHFFLEAQLQIAETLQKGDPGYDRFAADSRALLDWFGVQDLDTWFALSFEERRQYHEQFARGFEKYLWEGNAPNLEMQGLFSRFRSWIIRVYKDIRRLDVELTDEVRAVMDRMIASQDQIRVAQQARGMISMFSNLEASGLSPEDFAEIHRIGDEATDEAARELEAKSLRDMQWLNNARGREIKRLKQQAAALRREVRSQVRTQVMSRPVYQAWEFLTEKIDEDQPAGRIDTASAMEILGDDEAILKRLRDFKMTRAEGGLHPDIVAEQFGFSSGDELLRAIGAADNPKDAVEAETDARMLEQYGELTSEETLAREADRAIHNDLRARQVAAELAAIDKAMNPRAPAGTDIRGRRRTVAILPKAAKAFAEATIGRIRIRNIRPGQYAAAETRAARAAQTAHRKGNLAQSAAEKRNQLINLHLTKAAYAAQDEVQKSVQYLKKFAKDSVRKAITADYADQIDALLERFDLRLQSNKAIDRKNSLAEWLESQREQGMEPDIPKRLLDESQRTNYRELTVDELRELVDTIKQIEALGRLKGRLLTSKAKREYEAARDEIVASIEANSRNRKSDTRSPTTTTGRVAQKVRQFWSAHIKAATWARILDGGEDGGAMWEYFIRTANERGDMETRMRAEATQDLTRILAPVFKLGRMGGKGVHFPSIDRSLNREARIAIALNVGNDGNLQRLLGGEGWTLPQIQPVLESLTAEEWQAVQQIWDYFERYRPEIAAKERRIYGKEPNWVEPREIIVQTADGQTLTLRGGYYPIKYDPVASQKAEEQSDAEDARRQLQGAYTSATTRRSFTKTRVEEVNERPLLYSLAGLYNGVNEVIHDLSWHEWLIDVNKLLRSNRIDSAIRNAYGPEAKQQLKNWVRDVAAGEQGVHYAGEEVIGRLRQGVSAAGLGFNVSSALLQITGFNQSIVRVGARWIGRGIGQYIAHPLRTTREVTSKSSFMADRSRTQFRELNELRNRVQDESRFERSVRLGTYFLMMRMQRAVDVPTWIGAYEKAIANGSDESRAIILADQAVIDSQGGGMVKDLSAIERGGPALKIFTVFYSYMNTVFNLGVAQTMTQKSKAKLAVDYLMIFTVPAVVGTVFKDAITPGDSGEDDMEELAKRLAAEQLDYLMGTMVVVREFGDAAQIVTGAAGPGRQYGGPAGLRVINDAYRFTTQASQGEFDEAFRKSSINLLGAFTGLPAAQINRTWNGIEALAEGDTENPAAVLTGYQEPR